MEELFMVWNEENEFLIKELEATISRSNNSNVFLHVFVPKNSISIPRDYPWLVKHESLTSEEDAAKVGLIVHALQKYSSSTDRNVTNGRRKHSQQGTIYIVQNRNEDYGELIGVLRNSKGGSNVKVLLLNSFDSPPVSPEKERCAFCNAINNEEVEDAIENSPRVRRSNDFKITNDKVKASSPDSSSCLLCGRRRQRQYPRDEMNVKFSRHFNNKERRRIENYESLGNFQNGTSDDARKLDLAIENKGMRSQFPRYSIYNPRLHLRGSSNSDRGFIDDSEASECSSCGEKLHSLNPTRYAPDGIGNEEKRSKSSEEYNSRVKCHCSAEGMHICLSCLLMKLSRPPLELKLGRSESAPTVFFHGTFKTKGGGHVSDVQASIEAETLEKGTNTENDLGMFTWVKSSDKSTEIQIETREKSTNTPVEKSTHTMHEKSTSTDDLEVKIVDKVVENSLDETTADTQAELPIDVKKSFFFYCMFCPEKSYRSKRILNVHMKNNHKKCNCPCQQYFRTREDYLAHFYTVYPLPCLVDKKCPERFRNLYYQSLHHKDSHYAVRPFFCIPCCRLQDDKRMAQAAFTFQDIASLRIHASSHGHDPKEMYLVTIDDKPDDSKLPISMRCSGINYC